MLCATSFTLVLVLGGGPAATTLEVAIYQALRFDFDPGRAVLLSFIQVGLTLMVMARPQTVLGSHGRRPDQRRPRESSGCPRWAGHVLPDAVLIGLQDSFLSSADGLRSWCPALSADLSRLVGDALFWRATATSLSHRHCRSHHFGPDCKPDCPRPLFGGQSDQDHRYSPFWQACQGLPDH
jgi:thiamine transport system permease protein